MRVALAQINGVIGDFAGMEAAYRGAWERAAAGGAHLLLLPELATTGYPPRDLLVRAGFVDASLRLLHTVREWTRSGPAVAMGAVLPSAGAGGTLQNAAVVLSGGEWVGAQAKTLLPTYDVFDEHRYFEPAANRRPIEVGGVMLGLTICEDLWVGPVPASWGHRQYALDPAAELVEQGAQLLINLSASPFTLGKAERRRSLVADTARRLEVPTVYLNQVGAHDELIFDGHSLVVRPDGSVAARLADFSEDFLVVDVPIGVQQPAVGSEEYMGRVARSEPEEIYRALTLGIGDYVRKSGFRGIVLGLSGGIDSAVVATLSADALGADNVWGLAMPTRYSSHHSVEDAQALAHNLGIRCDIVSIDRTFQAMLDQLGPLFEGRSPDLTEENLQARIRAITLMGVSNKFGALLLSTSNKSEAAVGYTTLYGDMSGALAPLADVSKTRVYALARWLNRQGERIPERTISKPPSAELRPDQTDQDSLPPYDVVDAVLRACVELQQSAEEASRSTGIGFEVVQRLMRLIHGAEYKRWQSPPVLKLTEKAFGIGRRMPLVARYD